MTELNLNLSIDTESLRILKTSQLNVALAKPVNGGAPNVIWQSFDPFEENTVTWEERFGLYASNTQLSNGARIRKISQAKPPARDAAYYSFTADATFHGPFEGGTPATGTGQYGISNDMPSKSYSSLTFGLTQSAVINGVEAGFRPLNAQSVPAGLDVIFTPLTTVYVWLQHLALSETMITEVVSRYAKVTFGGDKTSHSLVYNPSKGVFVNATTEVMASASLPDVSDVQVRTPAIW